MTREEIMAKAKSLGPWYHEIQLIPGYSTNSYMAQYLAPVWEMIRQKRTDLDYRYKSVLDLGTMDGYWAFGAEARGAKQVVAGDIWQGAGTINPIWPWNRPGNGIERLLFAKEVLASRVVPVVNAEVQDLHRCLMPVMRNLALKGFDIIQCFGLLYHIPNPLLALREIRRCLADDGVLFLETACYEPHDTIHSQQPIMRFNRSPMLYDDGSTYWLPNDVCLREMLKDTGFSMGHITRVGQPPKPLSRICVACRKQPLIGVAEDF